MFFLCSENKGADQLICVFVFAYAKSRFSHDAAHFMLFHIQDKASNSNNPIYPIQIHEIYFNIGFNIFYFTPLYIT